MKVPAKLARQILGPSIGTKDRVTVPQPPSTNNLFLTVGKRRVKTPEYRAWILRALPLFATMRPVTEYPVRFCALIRGKVHHARDWDNYIKPLQDCAVSSGVLAADTLKYVWGGPVSYEAGDYEPVVDVWFTKVTEGM